MGKPEKLLAEWFWIERWDGSPAAALPLLARGLYREMLTRAWRLGGWLPADHDAIKRLVRVTDAEWKKAWPAVAPYWKADPNDSGRLVNETQLEVMEEARRRREDASEHGRRAARARHRALPEHNPSNARAVPGHQPPSPSPLTDSTKELLQSRPTSQALQQAAHAPNERCPTCANHGAVTGSVRYYADSEQFVCLQGKGGCGLRWRRKPAPEPDPPGFVFGLRRAVRDPEDEPIIPPHLRGKAS